MSNEKRDFDKLAASWDEMPRRVQLAANVAGAIKTAIELKPDMDVLDFGCGTGLLTLELQPFVRSITGLDTSRGMLDRLQAKIEQQQLPNVHVHYQDLQGGMALAGCYDLIVSSMTFHHVPDVAPLLAQLYAITAPGGRLCIADLDNEGGRFHDDPAGVFHQGFEREELCAAIRSAGYEDVGARTATELTKPDGSGGTARFTIFLATGRKTV